MIKVEVIGNYEKSNKLLQRGLRLIHKSNLDKYGIAGVEALEKATPKRTGKTSESWKYRILKDEKKQKMYIQWYNTNLASNGCPIAIIIQYGHTTKDGVYIQGIDYINPAIKPIFNDFKNGIKKELYGN